jgi:hypothetical protein
MKLFPGLFLAEQQLDFLARFYPYTGIRRFAVQEELTAFDGLLNTLSGSDGFLEIFQGIVIETNMRNTIRDKVGLSYFLGSICHVLEALQQNLWVNLGSGKSPKRCDDWPVD